MSKGIKAAVHIGIKNIQLRVIIWLLLVSLKILWEIDSLVCDANVDLLCFNKVSVNHCYREANRAVDFLAQKGHSCSSLQFLFDVHDFDLLSIIQKNALGWYSFRG